MVSCLELARAHCSPEDVAILTGKLAGICAREIARTLEMTEPTVDHRYRNALAFLRQQLQSTSAGGFE
jgi:DNA-directed RNA polymerase specialized sigma24 family protein